MHEWEVGRGRRTEELIAWLQKDFLKKQNGTGDSIPAMRSKGLAQTAR